MGIASPWDMKPTADESDDPEDIHHAEQLALARAAKEKLEYHGEIGWAIRTVDDYQRRASIALMGSDAHAPPPTSFELLAMQLVCVAAKSVHQAEAEKRRKRPVSNERLLEIWMQAKGSYPEKLEALASDPLTNGIRGYSPGQLRRRLRDELFITSGGAHPSRSRRECTKCGASFTTRKGHDDRFCRKHRPRD